MIHILLYNAITLLGTSTMEANEDVISWVEEPYIIIPNDAVVENPHAWLVDPDEETITFVGREITELRQGKSLTKRELALALKRNEVLSASDSVLVAKGEWPTVLLPFINQLGDLDPDGLAEIEIEWAGANDIDRMDTNILVFQSVLEISDALADEMFGVVPDV